MRVLLSIIIVFQFISSNAQYNITANFNSVHIGRNIDIGFSKKINNHSAGIGIKYNMNYLVTDNQNEIFKKRFFAIGFFEHFGINIGYQYNFNLKQSFLSPFIYYNAQFSNSHTRNEGFTPYKFDTISNTLLYQKFLVYFGPTIALENYLGVGYEVNINKYFFINNRIGGGIIFYFNVDDRLYGDGGNWELGYMISVGLGYRLKIKKSP